MMSRIASKMFAEKNADKKDKRNQDNSSWKS